MTTTIRGLVEIVVLAWFLTTVIITIGLMGGVL